LTIDGESKLNVTGRGEKNGSGHSKDMGASYAALGGTESDKPDDLTYGSYDQVPVNDPMHASQMGSGGGSDDKRGGGVVIIDVKNARINGEIRSNGNPSIIKVSSQFHAGSGGYIFISCNDQPCEITNNVFANGGYGSDDKVSNAGSGGRIVFNNVNIDDSHFEAYGG
jgi:hypothetical protein